MRRLTIVVVRVVRGSPWNYNLAIAISAAIKPTAGRVRLDGRAVTRVILVWTGNRELMSMVISLVMTIATLKGVPLVHHSMLTIPLLHIARVLGTCRLSSKYKPEADHRQTQNVSH